MITFFLYIIATLGIAYVFMSMRFTDVLWPKIFFRTHPFNNYLFRNARRIHISPDGFSIIYNGVLAEIVMRTDCIYPSYIVKVSGETILKGADAMAAHDICTYVARLTA